MIVAFRCGCSVFNTVFLCSSVLELFLSIDVLYYVLCFVWSPGRVAAAFATANGDPNKIPNTNTSQRRLQC